MEYITEEQFDAVGMNIMSVLNGHLKLINDLTRQSEEWYELICGLLNVVEDLQTRVSELEMTD
jgi:hypothetical protein